MFFDVDSPPPISRGSEIKINVWSGPRRTIHICEDIGLLEHAIVAVIIGPRSVACGPWQTDTIVA